MVHLDRAHKDLNEEEESELTACDGIRSAGSKGDPRASLIYDSCNAKKKVEKGRDKHVRFWQQK